MTKIDLSNILAAEMDKALNSEENKQMFSSSSVLEKLAFNRVADEGKLPSEVEEEMKKQSLQKTASTTCECPEKHECGDECKCPASCDCKKTKKSASEIVNALLKVSEDLENVGLAKLAALSIVLAEKVVEAKKKSTEKKDDDKKSSKSKSKKMTMKERMEKMRKAKSKGKGKKEKSKSSKKSSLDVNLMKRSQELHPAPVQSLKPELHETAPLSEVDAVLAALPPNAKGTKVSQTGEVFNVVPSQMVPIVTQVVQKLQSSGKLPWQKKYRVVG